MLELQEASALHKPDYNAGVDAVENSGPDKEYISVSVWSLPYFSLVGSAGIAVVLVLYYVQFIKPFIALPADILMWAETNFVGDIIKLRIGAPIYMPPADSNSFIYTPGAPILTYVISRLIGEPTSIVAWRVIQLGFALSAALVATACCRAIQRLAYPDNPVPFPKTWTAFVFLAMCLAATAPRTNPFAHALHADSLALLASVVTFWVVLQYVRAPSWGRIFLMAVCPALGYLTKQLLISWSAVIFVFLILWNPKEKGRIIAFLAATTTSILMVVGLCYWLWGDAYIFWTFQVTGGARKTIGFSPSNYNISLLRSFDHLIRAWPELSIGVIGGGLILRGNIIRKLGPLWVGWLVLVASEIFSSGVGWGVLHHFGPAVMIGTIWILAALSKIWFSTAALTDSQFPRLVYWAKYVSLTAGVLSIFILLHVVPSADRNEVRYWRRQPLPAVYRYISDIEREFEGIPADQILLDIGNWVYLRKSVLAKDRAVSLGDQPPGGIYENLEVMVGRIRNKTYTKILVHDLHSPFFNYDWADWPRSSGVKKALSEYYTEVRTIPGVGEDSLTLPMIMYTGPISVLIPKTGLDLKTMAKHN
jgi:hypothetical protein